MGEGRTNGGRRGETANSSLKLTFRTDLVKKSTIKGTNRID